MENRVPTIDILDLFVEIKAMRGGRLPDNPDLTLIRLVQTGMTHPELGLRAPNWATEMLVDNEGREATLPQILIEAAGEMGSLKANLRPKLGDREVQRIGNFCLVLSEQEKGEQVADLLTLAMHASVGGMERLFKKSFPYYPLKGATYEQKSKEGQRQQLACGALASFSERIVRALIFPIDDLHGYAADFCQQVDTLSAVRDMYGAALCGAAGGVAENFGTAEVVNALSQQTETGNEWLDNFCSITAQALCEVPSINVTTLEELQTLAQTVSLPGETDEIFETFKRRLQGLTGDRGVPTAQVKGGFRYKIDPDTAASWGLPGLVNVGGDVDEDGVRVSLDFLFLGDQWKRVVFLVSLRQDSSGNEQPALFLYDILDNDGSDQNIEWKLIQIANRLLERRTGELAVKFTAEQRRNAPRQTIAPVQASRDNSATQPQRPRRRRKVPEEDGYVEQDNSTQAESEPALEISEEMLRGLSNGVAQQVRKAVANYNRAKRADRKKMVRLYRGLPDYRRIRAGDYRILLVKTETGWEVDSVYHRKDTTQVLKGIRNRH